MESFWKKKKNRLRLHYGKYSAADGSIGLMFGKYA
jgi:hypothetical protein